MSLHYARLRRLCAALLGDRQEAEEVVQEVFLKAWEAELGAGAPRDWGAWLRRVAVNACHDRRRAGWWFRFRRRSEQAEDLPLLASERGPAELALGAEARKRIWNAFDRLPVRQREVFLLRYIEDMSMAEIAAALSVSSGSVKRHLFRAVHRLRAVLGSVR